MKRTTITLPEDLALVVVEEAKRRRSSVSEVIRLTLRESLIGRGKRALPFAAICDDSKMTVGAKVQDALQEGWADDIARDSR